MKKRIVLYLFPLVALVLSGCTFLDNVISFFKKDNPTGQKEETKKEEEQDPAEDENKIGEFYGGVVENKSYIGYEFSKSENEINKPTTGIGEINVYAFNDFHGSVVETNDEIGLKKLGTFFKEKSTEDNTLIFDQGDTWQGSFESNYQYGAIVQDVFNYAGVSLRTVGNHDFDWGLDHLEETNNRKIGNDFIPCLASNVFDYANGVNGTTQQSQYGKDYATFVLDNGIKVGVVGVIGKNQITSICSRNVETVCFTDHIVRIQNVSDFLRVRKNCDIIIASTHEGSSAMSHSGLDEISPVSGERYADLVLSGHNHYQQEYTENGVKYVQWDSNGKSTGSIKLKYDFVSKSLLDEDTEVKSYYPNYFKEHYQTVNPKIEKMVDDYLEEIEPKAEEVLSTNFVGNWESDNLARLMSEAIYSTLKSAGKTVDFTVCNSARTSFKGGDFTYRSLYLSFPFDNEIIMMDVSSSTSLQSIRYACSYKEDTSKELIIGYSYRIGILDYVGLHQNSYREYDSYPDGSNLETFVDSNGKPLLYREILRNYLLDNTTKIFNADDYTSGNPHFNFDRVR